MDWIRKNKFMTGFIAFVVIGAGVLIYLLLGQMSEYDQVAQDYNVAVKEVQRLDALEPYPEQASQRNLEDKRKKTLSSVSELQTQLANYEPPPEKANFKPIDFQDKLRRVVDEVSQAAQAAHVELPKDFYMGFEQYRAAPPEVVAAPVLSRELDAIQDLMMVLINKRIESLASIKRSPLSQETGGNLASTPVKPGPGNKPGAAPTGDSVTRSSVVVAFKCQPGSFRDSLDEFVASKRLFLVRAVDVKNEASAGPKKTVASTAEATPAPAATTGAADPAANAAAADKSTLRYIVGLEGLSVTMRVEIVRVSPAAL